MRLARTAIPGPRGSLALCLAACCIIAATPARAAEATQRPPAIDAREAILIETDLGKTLFSRHARREAPIASTTKLMTAYVTLEREPLTRVLVEQPYDAGPGESLAHLPAGGRYSVADLLRAMLLPSGNDVANSLAIDVGGTVPRFVAQMNGAARRLGLRGTHYATPVGLDTPGNYSTARNLAVLAEDLLRDPFFAAVVHEPNAYLPGGVEVTNHEGYLYAEYPFLVGVKSGHTAAAGYCFVGAASWHGVHLISVVLGDPTQAERDEDTIDLLRYGLALYHHVPFAVKGRAYKEVSVSGSAQPVALVAERDGGLVLARGEPVEVSFVGVPSDLQGPLAAGTPEGSLDVSEDGQLALSVPLVTAAALAAPAPSAGGLYAVALPVLLVLAGCSLMAMRGRLRRRRARA
jgi:D-alanyl-D-alanine carboxypeptidase (penicillin-binding protein 5/6)